MQFEAFAGRARSSARRGGASILSGCGPQRAELGVASVPARLAARLAARASRALAAEASVPAGARLERRGAGTLAAQTPAPMPRAGEPAGRRLGAPG